MSLMVYNEFRVRPASHTNETQRSKESSKSWFCIYTTRNEWMNKTKLFSHVTVFKMCSLKWHCSVEFLVFLSITSERLPAMWRGCQVPSCPISCLPCVVIIYVLCCLPNHLSSRFRHVMPSPCVCACLVDCLPRLDCFHVSLITLCI